ncbi:translocation protein TolB [Bacillus suaedaesalsae]|uniref:Translocation protein TolB n=1 Tax=Bacillus suaedaesalsae TaxID=2810349 RepID=A0ABS2DGA0_9BACI|nr:translocation protein TolB [Bacillus suaedaesalsae]MBM6617446.1 translocation protein TolB [Bacillus suaedaesalsae]
MRDKLVVLLLFSFLVATPIVKAEVPLKAAFIRNHQLWLKVGSEETQLTTGSYVHTPKWSYDGKFIAYIDGDERGEKSNLFIYDTIEKVNYQPYKTIETSLFKWSPVKNQLAYISGRVLNVTKMKRDRPHGFENVSLGASDFGWFPNGKELIVSSTSCLQPTGWGPIPIYRIPVDANLNPEKMKHFYTVQTNTTDLFAIGASYFKWSPDGKWVSFLGIPTASWSNDSNTLFVLSSKGEDFQVIGKMLGYADWMKWSPLENKLAYISGEGRFFVENKKTTVADIPISNQQQEYTPRGFVDLDLEWFSPSKIIVARAKENKDWNEGPVPTMFTELFVVNIKTNEQQQLTFPMKTEIDQDPLVFGSTITWYRRDAEEYKGDVWVKEGLEGKEYKWIADVDYPPALFHVKK